jgi:hypothetical protein
MSSAAPSSSSSSSHITPASQSDMTKFVSAVDSGVGAHSDHPHHPRIQRGENGHAEYSNAIQGLQEQLLQITFQSVRCDHAERFAIAKTFAGWVMDVVLPLYAPRIGNFYPLSPFSTAKHKELIELGFRSIAHLRDAESGKGECRLAYAMLLGWHDGLSRCVSQLFHYGLDLEDHPYCVTQRHKERENALRNMRDATTSELALSFLQPSSSSFAQAYGSYKDFKYMCQEAILYRNAGKADTDSNATTNKVFRFTDGDIAYLRWHPITATMAECLGTQVYRDWLALENDPSANISLAGKWAPRFGSDLFGPTAMLLTEYVVPEGKNWLQTAKNHKTNSTVLQSKAQLKIKTFYRKRLAKLNRHLHTVQVKQCDGQWSQIDFARDVTSVTMARQKAAFLRGGDKQAKQGDLVGSMDRFECRQNLTAHIEKAQLGEAVIKGKMVGLADFVRESYKLRDEEAVSSPLVSILNQQWEDSSSWIGPLEDMIPMVDTSASMSFDGTYPLYTAIGLGIRIAEKSKLGKRVLTFSSVPRWVSLSTAPDFHSCVKLVSKAEWGHNTDFYAALKCILDAAKQAALSEEEVAKLTLVVLSDMQMDEAGQFDTDSPLFKNIAEEFAATGIQVSGQPWRVPKIVFWNLRKTKGFPSKKDDTNAIMVSGGSDMVLNDLCENGMKAFDNVNPFSFLKHMLMNERYSFDKTGIVYCE